MKFIKTLLNNTSEHTSTNSKLAEKSLSKDAKASITGGTKTGLGPNGGPLLGGGWGVWGTSTQGGDKDRDGKRG